MVEEGLQLVQGHQHEVGDALAAHLHILRLSAQACAVAFGADRLAAVARQHHAVLYLIRLCLNIVEEVHDAFKILVAGPEEAHLFVGEFVEWLEDGDAHLVGHADEGVFPLAHLLAAPAGDGVLVDRQALVGHHQVGVDADDAAEALTGRAGAVRVVESEHIGRRRLEGDAVGLETRREVGFLALAVEFADHLAGLLAFVEGGLHRVGDAPDGVVHILVDLDAVDEQLHLLLADLFLLVEEILDFDDLAVI